MADLVNECDSSCESVTGAEVIFTPFFSFFHYHHLTMFFADISRKLAVDYRLIAHISWISSS